MVKIISVTVQHQIIDHGPELELELEMRPGYMTRDDFIGNGQEKLIQWTF